VRQPGFGLAFATVAPKRFELVLRRPSAGPRLDARNRSDCVKHSPPTPRQLSEEREAVGI
jgi:hypothetical protein